MVVLKADKSVASKVCKLAGYLVESKVAWKVDRSEQPSAAAMAVSKAEQMVVMMVVMRVETLAALTVVTMAEWMVD